jgi:2-polyprenyl-6-methoxyphenol hydroxylase-like FAD-dependent oxidoreductase
LAKRFDVAIVGGGPVGLLLACELGIRNVPVVVIDQRPELLPHPKANTHNARSMEIYRRHGIANRLRAIGLPQDRPTDVAYLTRFYGRELHRVVLPSPLEAQREVRQPGTRWPTPEPQLRTTQMALEPLLLDRARSFCSVEVRYGWNATAFSQDSTGVCLSGEQPGGAQFQVSAAFAVGCDGGRSFMRRQLGIRLLGEGGLEMDFLGGRMLATYFRAPQLLESFPHGPSWMNWIMHPSGRAILVVIDPQRHEFLMHFQLKPDARDTDFPARLAQAVGAPVEHEILSSAEWRAGVGLVAERYREGRAFLAGDAAHLFTPTGGFGLNTGIEDAFNLGWKLGAALRSESSPALLDSYDVERRAIGLRNTAYALKLTANNGACPVSPHLDEDGEAGDAARAQTAAHLARYARWEFDTPGMQLGGRYNGSPIISSDECDVPQDSPTTYVPSAVPGGRLPHVWDAQGRSLFDRLGPEFTAIGFRDLESETAWRAAAALTGVPITIVPLPAEGELARICNADWILVRPDQYIAWRGSARPGSLEDVLATAAGLARGGVDQNRTSRCPASEASRG